MPPVLSRPFPAPECLPLSFDLWHVKAQPDGKVLLCAQCALGEYLLPSMDRVHAAIAALDPAEINSALDGTIENSKCTCPAGLNKPRCQHSFTFNDVAKLRGEWHTSEDPIKYFVDQLKSHSVNVFESGGNHAGRNKQVTYFLGRRQVCRGFFGKCLGLSKHTVNRISAMVRGKQVAEPTRRKLPTYQHTSPAYDQCVAFWQSFFGDRAQTSGDGHRYFPVNLSLLHLS